MNPLKVSVAKLLVFWWLVLLVAGPAGLEYNYNSCFRAVVLYSFV